MDLSTRTAGGISGTLQMQPAHPHECVFPRHFKGNCSILYLLRRLRTAEPRCPSFPGKSSSPGTLQRGLGAYAAQSALAFKFKSQSSGVTVLQAGLCTVTAKLAPVMVSD